MKNLKLLTVMVLLLALGTAQAKGIPQLDEALFDDAKQILLYFADGDYESAAALLEFTDADELKKFVTGNFTCMDSDVQTFVSVAFWGYNSWYIAVPLADPVDGFVETLMLRSDDGDTFSGYKYCLWSEAESEYSKSDYVTWNEEYATADNLYIID